MNAQQHKARIERFDFLALRDFSAPADLDDDFSGGTQDEVEIPPAPPPPPTYSQAELDRARLSGFEEGFQKGVAEGKAVSVNEDSVLNQKLQTTLSKLSGDLAAAHQEFQELYQSKYHDLLGLALSVANKVAGAALKENADQSIMALIEQTLPMLLRQPKITVFVHPDIKLAVESHILRIAMESGYEGKVIVSSHPDLDIADCRLEWQDGSVERSTTGVWKEILQIIEGKDGNQKKLPPVISQEQNPAQPPQEATSAPPTQPQQHTLPTDVYDYISSHLDALDAKITNPDHPKE